MYASIRLALFAGAVTACSVSTSHAGLLASDDFSSYSAATNLNGLNGGFGFNGGYTVGAPSLGYLNEVRNGSPLSYPNYVSPDGGNYANLASGFGGPPFNFFQRTVDVTGAFAAYNDGTRVGANNTTLWGSFLYNEVNNADFYLQGAANQIFSLPTTGSNSLFLYRIEFGPANADVVTVWNNPDLSTWTPSATPTSTAGPGDYSFQTLVFVAPNDENEARFDNIRLGSEAIDVVPYAAVPEPTTLGLLAAGAILALRRRK